MLFFLRALIGLLQGFALFFVTQANALSEKQSLIIASLSLILYTIPVLTIQGLGSLRLKSLMVWMIFLIPMIAGVSLCSAWEYLPPNTLAFTAPDKQFSFGFIFCLSFFLWISHVLVLSGDKDRSFRASYETYFNLAWKVTLQIALSLLFLGLFWGLLNLIAALFGVIQMDVVREIMFKPWFAFPASTLVIAAGIHVTDVKPDLIRGIRTVFLSLLAWLLPLISIFLTAFLIVFVFLKGMKIWKEDLTIFLLSNLFVLIVLINAVYQDGRTKVKKFLMLSAQVASIILLPLTLIAVYSLFNLVSQKGWLVDTVAMAGFLSVALFYSIGYLMAAIKPSSHLKYIESCNFFGAFWVLAVLMAFLTPVINPAKISVKSQIARLESGQINPRSFDFYYLKTEGKRYGREALLNLKTHWKGSDLNWVREKAESTLNSQFSREEINESIIGTVRTYDNQQALPKSFLKQAWREGAPQNLPDCLIRSYGICNAWIVDLKINGMKKRSIILHAHNTLTGFQKNNQGLWEIFAIWSEDQGCKNKKDKVDQSRIKTKPPVPIPPKLQTLPDLEFLEKPFRLRMDRMNCL